MKRVTKIVIAAGLAVSLGLAAAAVSAHPYGPGPGWGGGHMGGYSPGYGMGPQGMFNGRYGNAEDGLAALKAELGITADQDSAWQIFANNAKKQQEYRQEWFAKMHEARRAASAPERLAQQTEFMKQRQAEMEANAAALKDLYATLTPEQKAIADQRFGGYGPGWPQGYRAGPRGYGR